MCRRPFWNGCSTTNFNVPCPERFLLSRSGQAQQRPARARTPHKNSLPCMPGSTFRAYERAAAIGPGPQLPQKQGSRRLAHNAQHQRMTAVPCSLCGDGALRQTGSGRRTKRPGASLHSLLAGPKNGSVSDGSGALCPPQKAPASDAAGAALSAGTPRRLLCGSTTADTSLPGTCAARPAPCGAPLKVAA